MGRDARPYSAVDTSGTKVALAELPLCSQHWLRTPEGLGSPTDADYNHGTAATTGRTAAGIQRWSGIWTVARQTIGLTLTAAWGDSGDRGALTTYIDLNTYHTQHLVLERLPLGKQGGGGGRKKPRQALDAR